MKDIPFFRQQTAWWCGPAILQMILEAFGFRVSQRLLARMSGTTKRHGMGAAGFRKVLPQFGIPMRSRTGAGWDHIRRALRDGGIVVVSYVEPAEEEAHYAVVLLVGRYSVTLNDPRNGRYFTLSRREFMRRWHSLNRWMLAAGGRAVDNAAPKRRIMTGRHPTRRK